MITTQPSKQPAKTRGGRRQSYTPRRRASSAEVAARRAKALTMANAGASYEKIGEALGISTQNAINDVARAIRDSVRIPAGQMQDKQRAIFLDILRVEYPAAMDANSPRHYPAIDRILAICAQEARLYGLNAPTRVNVVSNEDFAKQAAQMLAVTGPKPLLELLRGTETKGAVTDAEIVEDDWANIGVEDN